MNEVNDCVLYGLYPSRSAAEEAVVRLGYSGLDHFDVALLYACSTASKVLPQINQVNRTSRFIESKQCGALVGGMVRDLFLTLKEEGIPELFAKKYEKRLKEGNVLLSVHPQNSEWADAARHILQTTSAEEIQEKDCKDTSLNDDTDEWGVVNSDYRVPLV